MYIKDLQGLVLGVKSVNLLLAEFQRLKKNGTLGVFLLMPDVHSNFPTFAHETL